MCRGARQGRREQRNEGRAYQATGRALRHAFADCRNPTGSALRPGGRAPEEDGFCMAVKVSGRVVTILLVAAYALYTRARGRFDTLIRHKKLFLPLLTVALAKGAA